MRSIALCFTNLPTAECLSIYIAIYCVRDVRLTSSLVLRPLLYAGERAWYTPTAHGPNYW